MPALPSALTAAGAGLARSRSRRAARGGGDARKRSSRGWAAAAALALATQAPAAAYLSTWHQSGTLAVMPEVVSAVDRGEVHSGGVLFATPCHQTPFHSHVHRPGVRLDFLKCPPSDDGAPDEADRFWTNPGLSWRRDTEERRARARAGPGARRRRPRVTWWRTTRRCRPDRGSTRGSRDGNFAESSTCTTRTSRWTGKNKEGCGCSPGRDRGTTKTENRPRGKWSKAPRRAKKTNARGNCDDAPTRRDARRYENKAIYSRFTYDTIAPLPRARVPVPGGRDGPRSPYAPSYVLGTLTARRQSFSFPPRSRRRSCRAWSRPCALGCW